MRAMWAPWRMEFIRNCEEEGNCFLCEAVGQGEAKDGLVLKLTERAICVMNRYPYSNGHLLIAPRRHEGDLENLSDDELQAIMCLTVQAKKALQKAISPQGFNVGINIGRAAGAGLVDHLHLHLVPRWQGDTNFMAVLGDVRVIPQALRELTEQLRESWPAESDGQREPS